MPRKPYTSQDRRSLMEIAERIDKTGQQLRAVARLLEEFDVEELSVSHYKSMVKGMGHIEDFAHVAWKAWHDHLESLGEYHKRNGEGGVPENDKGTRPEPPKTEE